MIIYFLANYFINIQLINNLYKNKIILLFIFNFIKKNIVNLY
jgi:hypothetical protein